MIKVKRKVEFARGPAGRQRLRPPKAANQTQDGRTPRVAKLLALAIRFDGLLRSGTISDQTELARLAQVSQPRMTQILNLLHLAPDLQEQILFLPPVKWGRDPIHEKMLRALTAQIDWEKQREMWSQLHAGK
jgi:hypothetical protein